VSSFTVPYRQTATPPILLTAFTSSFNTGDLSKYFASFINPTRTSILPFIATSNVSINVNNISYFYVSPTHLARPLSFHISPSRTTSTGLETYLGTPLVEYQTRTIAFPSKMSLKISDLVIVATTAPFTMKNISLVTASRSISWMMSPRTTTTAHFTLYSSILPITNSLNASWISMVLISAILDFCIYSMKFRVTTFLLFK